ncbi:hypothetical protein [Paenibacillus stellifer]|uniref:hypothetical protein n=1 Tax=Paenibacillus stellifer TaxID=169760 RepID=UPI000A59B383|nr:hypothetical protein [Paenibacillus stellifer]
MLETFALYFLVMCLFRYKFKDYAWHAIGLTLLINFQSYILRNDFSFGSLMPLVTIFFFIAFFKVVVKMPFIFATIATISGYVIFGVIQSVLAIMMFGSIGAVEHSIGNGYLLQFATGAVIMPISWFVYRMGYGFTFDLNKLRFKFEDIITVILIIFFLLSVTSFLYFQQLYMNTIFFVATSAYLLYYSVRKDNESD